MNILEPDNFVECGRTTCRTSATRDVASLLARAPIARPGYKACIHRNAGDPNELFLVKTECYEHLDMQKIERGIYYKHRIKGLGGEAISVMVDGMG